MLKIWNHQQLNQSTETRNMFSVKVVCDVLSDGTSLIVCMCSCRRRVLSSWRRMLISAVTSSSRLKCKLPINNSDSRLLILINHKLYYWVWQREPVLSPSHLFFFFCQGGFVQDLRGGRLRLLCGDEPRRSSAIHRQEDESTHSVSSSSRDRKHKPFFLLLWFYTCSKLKTTTTALTSHVWGLS